MMDRTLKTISLLLSYPTRALQAEMPVLADVVASDRRLPKTLRRDLVSLMSEIQTRDIYDLEERYVMLFDRSRTLSLNLFEHVHGESRDRGGAMVSLLETYRNGGYEPTTSELPDHLPVLLEYLATQPTREARDILGDAAHILGALNARLSRRQSTYAAAFAALIRLSGAKPDAATMAELLEEPDTDPNDLQALDAVWEESEVRFGPDPNAGCPQVRKMLGRMGDPTMPNSDLAAE